MCFNKLLGLCSIALMLSACGGGGDGGGSSNAPPNTTPTPSVGIFEDSPVAGLAYQTPTFSGTTNSAGEYNYLPGEIVTFSIGGILLGSADAGPVVTPLSLVSGATDATDPEVTNIVRVILTMDDDGNPDNGINITEAAASAADGLAVDFNAADLSTDAGVVSLLAALPGSPALVDAPTAQSHFSATLAAQSSWGAMTWGTGTWQSANP